MAAAYWRCDSIVTDEWVEMKPAFGAGPPGEMVPVPCSRQRPCGTEYYEATSADGGDMQFCAMCDSNGAIGRCANDHRMVCGYCSQMSGGRRLCNECIAAAADQVAGAEKRAKDTAQEAEFAEVRRELDRALEALASLAQVEDEIDRFLLLTILSDQLRVHFSYFPGKAIDRIYEDLRTGLVSAASTLRQSSGALWDISSGFPAAWKSSPKEIIKNLQAAGRGPHRATSTDLVLISHEKRALRGLTKVRRQTEGWKIQEGGGTDRYVLTGWAVATVPANNREIEPEQRGPGFQLSHIYKLMKSGHVVPVDIPMSLVVNQLPGITIPWLPDAGI